MKAVIALSIAGLMAAPAVAQSNLTPSGRAPSGNLYIQPKLSAVPNSPNDIPRPKLRKKAKAATAGAAEPNPAPPATPRPDGPER